MKPGTLVALGILAPLLGASPVLYLGKTVDTSPKPALYGTKLTKGEDVVRMPPTAIDDLSGGRFLEIIGEYDKRRERNADNDNSLAALKGWQEPGAKVNYAFEMIANRGQYEVKEGRGLGFYVRSEYARQNNGNGPSDSHLMLMNTACAKDNGLRDANVVQTGQTLKLYRCVKNPETIGVSTAAEPKPRFNAKAFFQGLNPHH